MTIINNLLRPSGLFILACLTIYLSSCKTTEIVLHGNLDGTVSDIISSEPIKDALVELVSSNQSALTDSSGYYQIRSIDPLNYYDVRASADGYLTNEHIAYIREAEASSLDFSLERSGIAVFFLDSLEFGFKSDSITFSLSNTGKEQMNYTFVQSEPWISIDPISGFLDVADSVAVTVSIDRRDLSNSTHEEYIQINTVNGNDALDLFVNRVMDMDTNFYKVVEIGDQIWMAENLNVGTRIDINPPYNSYWDIPEEDLMDQTDEIINKYCYENLESNCDKYGGLYQWWEAMQWWEDGEPTPIGPTQGICPDGWHIPTETDWTSLIEFLGGEESAVSKLTEGTQDCVNNDPSPNDSGFNSLLGGYLRMYRGGWIDKGKADVYWKDYIEFATFAGTSFIGCRLNDETYPLFYTVWSRDISFGLPVRCIKDSP